MIGITERGDAALDIGWTQWVIHEKKPAILITKNPGLLNKFITSKDNVIIHATITGMGGTKVEPNVSRLDCPTTAFNYGELVKKFGTERVVLRIDPVVPTEKGTLTAQRVITTLRNAGHPIDRVRISFLDMYNHVKDRFKSAGVRIPYESFHAPKKMREIALNTLQRMVDRPIEVCGEPDFKCTGCISKLDCNILGVNPSSGSSGQRQLCACLSLKKELLTNRKQCAHGCLYCYWRQ